MDEQTITSLLFRALPEFATNDFETRLAECEAMGNAIAERARRIRGEKTDWWVMVKEENGKWFPVGCVSEEDESFYECWYPEFDAILPIPDPKTIPEFGGF